MSNTNSIELKILLASIKLTVLQGGHPEFEHLLHNSTINWNKLHQLLTYHKIRPIFLAACNQINFKHKELCHLDLYCKIETIRKTYIKDELRIIFSLFSENNVEIIPYYGSFYLECLYDNTSFREADRIQLFVKKKDIVLAIKLLKNTGFDLKVENSNSLEKIMEATFNNFVILNKKLTNGIYVQIQIYWQIAIESEYDLFPPLNTDFLEHQQYKLWDKDFLFKMVIGVQNERSKWLCLKNIVDLLSYLRRYPAKNTEQLLSLSEEIKMKKVTNLGLSLIDGHFNVHIQESLYPQTSIISKIVYFWENNSNQKSFYNSLLLYRIYKKTLDIKIPWYVLVIKFLQSPSRFEDTYS